MKAFFYGFAIGFTFNQWLASKKPANDTFKHELENAACFHCQIQKKWEKDFNDQK